MNEALSAIHKCVQWSGRREAALLAPGSAAAALLGQQLQHSLLAYRAVLHQLAHDHLDQVRATCRRKWCYELGAVVCEHALGWTATDIVAKLVPLSVNMF